MMKYFLAIALIATVASAAVRPTPLSAEAAEIQEIIAAIQSPSTDPATAAALEQMLLDVLGVKPEPVAVGPALVEYEPISVGPAVVDFPLPDGGAVPETVAPSPVAIVDGPADVSASAPLVQIILNINQAAASNPIAVNPVVVAPPTPVDVAEPAQPPINPIVVNPIGVVGPQPPVNPIAVNPIGVGAPQPPVNPIAVNPIGVAPVEPVQVGIPVIPEPAVVLPEELN